LLNAIFELSPDGFISFDEALRVSYVSPAFARMTELAPATLIGMGELHLTSLLADLCLPSGRFRGIAHLRENAKGGKPNERELIELALAGGRILEVGLRTSDGSAVSQILYCRDVTHETEVDRMKSEFLSTAAHELRSPMASIFGFTELLLMQKNDVAAQQESLEIIYKQSKLMAQILDELLDLARIEARRGKDFNYTRVCVQELAADLIKAFQPPEGRRAPVLVAPTQQVFVMADVGKLRQAILNVVVNAYKFSSAAGDVIIELELHAGENSASTMYVHVTDTGIGMTPEQLTHVCTRFYRADKSGKVPGTGLGMSIVKEIVELHRGEISIVSSLGKGTRVTLRLPVSVPNI
jgi:signal transduction histidine kinase